jgi:hypothetical protein
MPGIPQGARQNRLVGTEDVLPKDEGHKSNAEMLKTEKLKAEIIKQKSRDQKSEVRGRGLV